MYHDNVKLSFKSFMSALLGVMLIAVAVCAQANTLILKPARCERQ
ncbi:MAG TPA: hypothetical protein VGJ48_09665 [Pyrinomonadaceae bacterium]|nr:hypothetical protein [Pyrinomonadaceae bacterium]